MALYTNILCKLSFISSVYTPKPGNFTSYTKNVDLSYKKLNLTPKYRALRLPEFFFLESQLTVRNSIGHFTLVIAAPGVKFCVRLKLCLKL